MNDFFEDDAFLEKSKSQIKRELLALQDLGRTLVDLPDKQLAKIPMSDEMREEILKARGFTRGALKRQIQFIGGRMRDEDHEAIKAALEGQAAEHRQAVKQFHRLEEWRERLIGGDDELLNQLVLEHQGDRQHLRQLIRNAERENKAGKPPKSSRQLFKYLQELLSE